MKHLLLVLLALLVLSRPDLSAQGKIDLHPNDTMHSVLESQVGKPVELRMKSGDKIAGKLEKVTGKLAYLSQLKDADFYDAAVDIDNVEAVVVRARSN